LSTMSEQALLRVTRKKAVYRDRFAKYAVLLDGEPIGAIRNGGTEQFRVVPGPHSIRIRVAGKYSPTVAFDAEPKSLVDFECQQGGPALLSLFDALFRRGRYVRLARASPDG